MSVIDKLASSLGRRDEVPNQILAKQIANKNDKKAIKELIDHLHNGKKDIQFDCIKTLYEIGAQKPKLIADYAKDFIILLDNKNNRLQWGAMTALSAITPENPGAIYKALDKIIDTADKGTVITKDHCVKILAALAVIKKYHDMAVELLMDQILRAPENQMPTYAETTAPFITEKYIEQFLHILTIRLKDIVSETKSKRVEKVIKKLNVSR